MAFESRRPVILLAFANDRDDRARYLRNLPEEARQIRAALDPAERAMLCKIVKRQNATATKLLDVFQDERYHDRLAVFRFAGRANGYRLLLASTEGRPTT